MRHSIKVLFVLLFAVTCFSAGYAYQYFKLWYQFPVEVTLQNQLGESINSLKLTFKSGINGTLTIPSLDDGKSITLKYYPWSEGSFSIEANSESGKVLTYQQGYVEAGYSFTWLITRDTLGN